MSRRMGVAVLLVALTAVLPSCQELPQMPALGEGELDIDPVPQPNAVPAEWGRLVAVTNDPQFGHLFQLWFEDEAGTLRMVTYNDRWQRLSGAAVRVERTGGVQP